MKKISGISRLLMLVLALSVISSSFLVYADEKPSVLDRHIYESVYLGEPLTREDILHCAYSVVDGKQMMYTTLASRPTATFIAYNLTDKKLDFSTPLQISPAFATKTSWSHRIGKDGCIYLVPHGYISLFKYDPVARKMYDSGSIVEGLHAAYAVCFDDEGNIFYGGVPTAKVYMYNSKLELVKEFGPVFPGESYVMSMGCYNGKLYAGGQDEETHFKSIDIKTGEIKEIESPLIKYGVEDKISSYYMMDQMDNLLFCTVKLQSGKYSLFIFDAKKEEWVFYHKRAYGHYMAPVKDGLTYFIGSYDVESTKMDDVGLLSLNLENFEVKDTGVRYYGNIIGSAWMEIKDDPELPGESLVFFSRSDNKMIALNLETKKSKLLDYELPAVGVTIQDIETGIDGTLLMGSYMGDEMVVYNPTTGEKTRYASTQTESIKRYGDIAYAGCYTQGVMYKYDLTKPPSANNPEVLSNLSKYHQERIFDFEVLDDCIVMGTYPNKGYTNGGLAIYDYKTKETILYDDVSPGQSVEGVAYKDGYIYGCTSIYINANPIPTDEACVFKFDMATKKVVKRTCLKLDGISEKLTSMGDLEIGPDGNLWGVSSGVIFCLDPETLDVIKYVQADPVYPRRTMSKIAAMYWDDNGYLYTVCNGYFIILDPETMEFKHTRRSMQYFVIGEDNNIYYNHWSTEGSHFSKFTISALKTDEVKKVQSALSEGIVLKKGNSFAINNGKPSVFPGEIKEENGKMMVPIRFVSEAIGATVAWSSVQNTAVVRTKKTALKVTVGDDVMYVNGKGIKMDKPFELINGTSYISLDSFVEAFDMNLYTDEDGLIVLTSAEKTFTVDEKIKDNIHLYMDKDVPSLSSGNYVNKFIE